MKNINQLFQDFLDYCNMLNDSIIIVEGKRDRETLQKYGLTNQIIEMGGLSINKLVDRVLNYSVIIILTDFDKQGKKLRAEIKKEIQHRKGHGIIDSYPRQVLYQFCRNYRISEIEDLDKFLFPLSKDKRKNFLPNEI